MIDTSSVLAQFRQAAEARGLALFDGLYAALARGTPPARRPVRKPHQGPAAE